MSTDRERETILKETMRSVFLYTQGTGESSQMVWDHMIKLVGDLNNLPIILEMLRTENMECMNMFVLTEILAKAYLKDCTFGVASFSINSKTVDPATLSSSEFRAKKAVIDTCLQLLVEKGNGLPSLVLQSLENLIGSGLALLWIEMNHDDNYLLRIEEGFFSSTNPLLESIGSMR